MTTRLGRLGRVIIAAAAVSGIGFAQSKAIPNDVTSLGVEEFEHLPTATKASIAINTVVSFTLVNHSNKPIFGYSLLLTLTMPDGSTKVRDHSDDFTARSLPAPAELIEAYKVLPVDSLQAGERRKVQVLVYNDPMPIKITAAVFAVVFADNSVEGDIQQATRDFFEPHQQILDECKWYLQALETIGASPDVRAALGKLLSRYLNAMAASHATVAIVSNSKLSFDRTDQMALPKMYMRFRLELQEGIERIDRGKLTPGEALQRCLAYAQPRIAEYAAHLKPH